MLEPFRVAERTLKHEPERDLTVAGVLSEKTSRATQPTTVPGRRPRPPWLASVMLAGLWLVVLLPAFVLVINHAGSGAQARTSGSTSLASTGGHGQGSAAGSMGSMDSMGMGSMGSMDMSHEAATAYSGFIRTPDQTLTVDVTPATPGPNTIAIAVLDAVKETAAPVTTWSASASLPGSNLPAVAVPLVSFGQGVAAATPDLPTAGNWTLTITVQIPGVGQKSFSHVIPIRPAS